MHLRLSGRLHDLQRRVCEGWKERAEGRFNEVKVAYQLMWNSQSQKFMGLAMAHDE